jgi:hypothetical protein
MGQWDGEGLQFEYVPLQDALFTILDMCTSETETYTLKDIEEVAREAVMPQVIDEDEKSIKEAQAKASQSEIPDWVRAGPGKASSGSEETALPDEETSSQD